MTRQHDVAIIGGGLVGASLAIALDRLDVDVALVEASAGAAPPAVFDERSLSFAEATVNGLHALGVMQRLRQPAGPIRRIHVSRRGDFGRACIDASDHGRDAFGQVVVARDFGLALEAGLAAATRVTRYRPMRFVGCEAPADGVRHVHLDASDGGSSHTLATRLLVAADGTASSVRDALEIGADDDDYAQVLFVARLRAARRPDGTAYERFGDDGPTALLPRGDGHFGLVHGVAARAAATVAALDDHAFLARVQEAFGWRVGALQAVGARSTYHARRLVARGLVRDRAVLVGNAAQTVHPIGAQGFNLGLRDALTLAELIGAHAGDPGAADLLAAHAARRAEDRQRTISFSDGLARITANPGALLRPWRSLGLLAVDRLGFAQAALVGGAMGYRGDVPALCRRTAA